MKPVLLFFMISFSALVASGQCRIPEMAIFHCGTQEEAFLKDFSMSLNDERMSEESRLTLNQGTKYRFRACYVKTQGEKLTMSLLSPQGQIVASKQFTEDALVYIDFCPPETAEYVFIINVQNPTRRKVCIAAALFYL